MADNRVDRIRERAFELWQREGSPDGRAEDHWQQAEREIDAEDAKGETDALVETESVLQGGRPHKEKS